MTAPNQPAQRRRLDLLAVTPTSCGPDSLGRSDARSLAQRLVRGVSFARLVECRRGTAGELVVMDVDVEVPQRPAYDIRLEERIGLWFDAADSSGVDNPPEVFALRDDFPGDAPHVNLRAHDYPRSLCLYDVAFAELRLTWTPARLVTLVRDWLRLTARGELHAADQPLEPLLSGGHGWIVLPSVLRERDTVLGLKRRGEIGGKPVLIAVPAHEVAHEERRFVVASIRTKPRTHGVIRRAPATLKDLHEMLAEGGDDFRERLSVTVEHWKEQGVGLDVQVAIVLLVPMRRADRAEPEVEQPWAFLTTESLGTVGQSLGLWEQSEHGLATLIGDVKGDAGASINLLLLNAHWEHTRHDAARFNGRPAVDDRRLLAVGAGALGSQVLMCAARSSFGQWTVVDSDVLLPHNLARHALGEEAVGWPKASGVVVAMSRTSSDSQVHAAINANVLSPSSEAAELEHALEDATAIVDMSASVAVARTLARDCAGSARRISLFLNPSGTDLALLTEAEDRSVRLDALEMQYYRAVATDPTLSDTLLGAVSRERYGRSCRDVSVQLPHARVALHAAIGAQALESAVNDPDPAIRVWRLDKSLGVRAVIVAVQPSIEMELGDWRLVTDIGLLARIHALRHQKLPNETGGVLLGAVDIARRIVYVADTIPSPPDSEEWPTLYIRGAAGVAAEVERVQKVTAGQLHYVGEWHSHPRHCAPLPSSDDLKVFAWITEALDPDDLPAVMMIVADEGTAAFVGQIDRDERPILLVPMTSE